MLLLQLKNFSPSLNTSNLKNKAIFDMNFTLDVCDIVSFPKLDFELSLETIYQYVNVPQFATIPNIDDDNDAE